MPVIQSYQPPPQSYNDPANFPTNYDRPLGQYSGEQLISRGGPQRTAPTRPSPPTTGVFHDPMGGYRPKGGEPDMYSGSFKGPAVYNAPSGVLGGSAEVGSVVRLCGGKITSRNYCLSTFRRFFSCMITKYLTYRVSVSL